MEGREWMWNAEVWKSRTLSWMRRKHVYYVPLIGNVLKAPSARLKILPGDLNLLDSLLRGDPFAFYKHRCTNAMDTQVDAHTHTHLDVSSGRTWGRQWQSCRSGRWGGTWGGVVIVAQRSQSTRTTFHLPSKTEKLHFCCVSYKRTPICLSAVLWECTQRTLGDESAHVSLQESERRDKPLEAKSLPWAPFSKLLLADAHHCLQTSI